MKSLQSFVAYIVKEKGCRFPAVIFLAGVAASFLLTAIPVLWAGDFPRAFSFDWGNTLLWWAGLSCAVLLFRYGDKRASQQKKGILWATSLAIALLLLITFAL